MPHHDGMGNRQSNVLYRAVGYLKGVTGTITYSNNMRKIATVAIVIALSTISCKKEKCYICTTTYILGTTQTVEGYPKTVTGDIIELCDTEEVIKDYEESNQGLYLEIVNGYTIITSYRTNCEKE